MNELQVNNRGMRKWKDEIVMTTTQEEREEVEMKCEEGEGP